jgi:hypothetical protein
MSRFRLLIVIGLVCLMSWSLVGCGDDAPAPSVSSGVAVGGAGIGEAFEIGDGLSVTMASSDTTAPDSLESSPQPSPHWMLFEVTNSSDSSATFPSRPLHPSVVDVNGESLDVPGIRVELIDGGGGWGPAAAHRGQPYLNPGGLMRVWCELPELPEAKRPLTVRYAPTRGQSAVFIIE